jgi:hypothetical protein
MILCSGKTRVGRWQIHPVVNRYATFRRACAVLCSACAVPVQCLCSACAVPVQCLVQCPCSSASAGCRAWSNQAIKSTRVPTLNHSHSRPNAPSSSSVRFTCTVAPMGTCPYAPRPVRSEPLRRGKGGNEMRRPGWCSMKWGNGRAVWSRILCIRSTEYSVLCTQQWSHVAWDSADKRQNNGAASEAVAGLTDSPLCMQLVS